MPSVRGALIHDSLQIGDRLAIEDVRQQSACLGESGFDPGCSGLVVGTGAVLSPVVFATEAGRRRAAERSFAVFCPSSEV